MQRSHRNRICINPVSYDLRGHQSVCWCTVQSNNGWIDAFWIASSKSSIEDDSNAFFGIRFSDSVKFLFCNLFSTMMMINSELPNRHRDAGRPFIDADWNIFFHSSLSIVEEFVEWTFKNSLIDEMHQCFFVKIKLDNSSDCRAFLNWCKMQLLLQFAGLNVHL